MQILSKSKNSKNNTKDAYNKELKKESLDVARDKMISHTHEYVSKRSIKLAVRDLNLWYKSLHILKGINLDFYKNKIIAIIGPSGCGKSSFLRCLNRMNSVVSSSKMSGNILLDGKDIYTKDVDEVLVRKRVGMVFQHPNPFPKSIYENIVYAPKLNNMIKNKKEQDDLVKESLEATNLWKEVKDKLKSLGTSLSGGQQQRLCIARAVAMKPEVILMDEPTSAIDHISSEKIENLMLKLKEKFTVVTVTHNMQQAARISDYTAFFHLGNLVEYGKTKDIFLSPKQKKTEEYITGRFG